MAKKETTDKAAEVAAPAAAPAEVKEAKGKPKAEKADKAPKAEKPEKAVKPAKEPKETTKEKAPKEGAPTGAPAAPTAAAPAAPGEAPAIMPVEGEKPSKKKGKTPGRPPRLGKKLRASLKNREEAFAKAGTVPVKQAVGLLKQYKRAKFDETVEVHMNLGIDSRQSDQMVRGSVALPHGLGKSKRVLVFAQGADIDKAKAAGADHVGGDDLAKKIQSENFLDFDVALAMPNMMGVVGRLGKILGPRGLMPSPKAGTVIAGDITAAVKEFKAGKVEFRADAGGNIHAPVGKLSFDENKLVENINTLVETVRASRPSAVKGHFVKSITLSATMSPGVPLAM
jgi:large subunit ribosomal protein L1